jgi:hypothetical protein
LFEGTGNVLQEDASLFWDNTNKRLGVGATPDTSTRLDVRAQGALSTDIAFKVRNSANTADFIAVNGLGNVGIGTTASTEKLTVWNDTAASIGIHTNRENAGDLATLRFSTVTNGDADLRKKGAIFFKANGTGNGRGDLQFAVNNAADSSNAGVANAVMTLQADGNVGIGISTPAASAKLDITSTTQGFLPPRMTTAQRNAIVTPATGLIVYDNTLLSLYQFNGTAWVAVGAGGGSTKSINSVSTNTAAGSSASTDYFYFASGTINITLPTAVGNNNNYVIKNVGTGTITIDTTSSQTIDGSLTAPIKVQYLSLTLISDGANWNII